MRRLVLPIALIVLSACSGGAAAESTTTSAPTSSTTTSTTMTTSTTTTTTIPTTTTEPTVTVDHSILVYEGYEATESLEVGEPCITVGDINPIRPGNRIIVWDETGESIVTSGDITGGTIEYDLSGPPLDDGGGELFYFCSFGVVLENLPRDGAFRFEYPGADELSGTITAQDLRGGTQTTYSDANFESERQRIRAEQ